jgi:hypothetical protein
VFGPDKFHKQWLVAGLVLAMVTLARRAVSAWIFGFLGWNVWPYMYHVRGVRVAQAYLLPFYWTAMQMPLWGWRLGAGWRIVRASDAASPTAAQSRQVSMYDFLGMILLVGVLFNLARLGTSHWSNFVEPCGTLEETLWLAAWLMLASLLFLPSCVFVSLASDRWQRTLAGQTLVVALGPIALMILRVLIHTWQAWSWRFSWLHQLVSSSMPSLGGLLTVFAVLWLARRSGYRLIWIRRQVAESLRDSKPLRVTE